MKGSDQPPARLWAYDYDSSTEAMQWVEIEVTHVTSKFLWGGKKRRYRLCDRKGIADNGRARSRDCVDYYTEAAMQAERKDDEYILTLDEQKTRHDERDGAVLTPANRPDRDHMIA